MRIRGFQIRIYPNDHRPPHVHAVGSKGEAVLLLNCPDGPPTIRESVGLNGPEVRAMLKELLPQISVLCAASETIRANFR